MADVELNDLTNTIGEWLRASGPQADIVMSTRIRLARNLADYPFVTKASDQDRADIERTLREKLLHLQASANEFMYVNVGDLDKVDRQFLVERQLISREHAEGKGARGVVIDPREQVSL